MAATPKAAALFHWKSLRRQVRLRGAVARIADGEADAYFASRPRVSRIGAWASQQSRPLESRAKLEEAVASYTEKFGEGEIPRPPYWGGYRLTPIEIEFWQDGAVPSARPRPVQPRERAASPGAASAFIPEARAPGKCDNPGLAPSSRIRPT